MSMPAVGVTAGGDVATAATPMGSMLQQLTTVTQSLNQLVQQLSGVAGANGGGPAGTPGQTPPGKVDQNATQAGGPTPPASTVAGANGTPAADANAGAQQVQGGGSSIASNPALVQALQAVVQAITALITALQAQVAGASGGGAPGKVAQGGGDVPPAPPVTPASPTTPDASTVAGANGGGAPGKVTQVTQVPPMKTMDPPPAPTQVAGANGAPGKPVQGPPMKHPLPAQVGGMNGWPVQQVPNQGPPMKVGGASGSPIQGPTQTPTQAPTKLPDPVPTQVLTFLPTHVPSSWVEGATGAPVDSPAPVVQASPPAKQETPPAKVQQTPVQQVPVQQSPSQVGGANGGPVQQAPVEATKGGVILDNDDERWSAKLTSDKGNSVEVWGDPHVVLNFGGATETFDIGYGAASFTTSAGNQISWNTYEPGSEHQFVLQDFKVDSLGSSLDRSVTTSDRNGEAGDQMGLTTALHDGELTEFATYLRANQGPMSSPFTPTDTPAKK